MQADLADKLPVGCGELVDRAAVAGAGKGGPPCLGRWDGMPACLGADANAGRARASLDGIVRKVSNWFRVLLPGSKSTVPENFPARNRLPLLSSATASTSLNPPACVLSMRA